MVIEVPSNIRLYRGRCLQGRECIAGEPITDEETRKEAIEVLTEALSRLEKWKIYGTEWLSEYAGSIEGSINRLKGDGEYPGPIIEAMDRVIKPTLRNIISNLNQYWEGTISREIQELIDDVTTGKTEAIISRTDKTLTVHIYKNHTTLTANKIRNNNKGITTQIRIKGLKGTTTEIPNVFKEIINNEEEYKQFEKKVLTPEQMGFAKTDEGDGKGKPVMITAHLWQAVLWPLLYPGEVYVNINGIDVNKSGVKIKWYLVANNYSSLKEKALDIIKEFKDEELMRFMVTAILGDGTVRLMRQRNGKPKPIIKLSIGGAKFEEWKPILSMLRGIGINLREINDESKGEVQVLIRYNAAIDLARRIINNTPLIMRALFDVLNIDKWNRLKQIADMTPRRGSSQVEIAGIRFSVDILKNRVELRTVRCSETKINEIIERLNHVYGEGIDIRKRRAGECAKVIIPWDEIKARSDIKEKVVQKLNEMLNNVNSDDKKEQLTKILTELINAP